MTGAEGRTLNEEVWIRKAQLGEEEAFRRLVDRHAPVIWTVINRMVQDSSKAQDLFQETIIRFWKGLPSFQGTSKLSTWLYRIAYRVCLDGIKSSKRSLEDASLDERYEDVGFEPEDILASGQRLENKVAARDALERGLNSLPEEWRGMLVLHYWRGLSMGEIADITERPVNTVKVYLHRARSALRKVLSDGDWPLGS